MDAVTAAVLADVAFDAVGEATKFSTRRYREKSSSFAKPETQPRAWEKNIV